MPNPGGIYRGCDTCRRRKLKCDQTFPSCRRCCKAGLSCSGVLMATDAMFKDETFKTYQKAAQLKSPPAQYFPAPHVAPISNAGMTPTSEYYESLQMMEAYSGFPQSRTDEGIDESDDNSAWFPFGLEVSHQPDAALIEQRSTNSFFPSPPSLLLKTTDLMAEYFFQQVVMPKTWLAGLPQLYSHSHDESALRHAIHAASMFLMTNQTSDYSAAQAAHSSYSRCLRRLNSALGIASEKSKDQTICTVLVLHLMNDIAGERSKTSGLHLKGCKSLLLRRESDHDSVYSNCEIANSLVIQSQAYVLKHYDDWSELFGEEICSRASARPAAELLRQCNAIGKLRSGIKNLSNLQIGTESHLQDLWLDALGEAESIDEVLQDWLAGLHGRWQRGRVAHQLPNTTINITVEYFDDIQVGKVWNQHRCARILLHETMIQIAERLLSAGSSSVNHRLVHRIKDSAGTITSLLAEICESIPFHLLQVDSKGSLVTNSSMRVLGGEHLLWPLEVVFLSPWSSSTQRTQARNALNEIGSLGLRQASKTILEEVQSPIESSGRGQQGIGSGV